MQCQRFFAGVMTSDGFRSSWNGHRPISSSAVPHQLDPPRLGQPLDRDLPLQPLDLCSGILPAIVHLLFRFLLKTCQVLLHDSLASTQNSIYAILRSTDGFGVFMLTYTAVVPKNHHWRVKFPAPRPAPQGERLTQPSSPRRSAFTSQDSSLRGRNVAAYARCHPQPGRGAGRERR